MNTEEDDIFSAIDPTDRALGIANQSANVTLKNFLTQTIISAGFGKEMEKMRNILVQELPERIGKPIRDLLGRTLDERDPITPSTLKEQAEVIAEQAVQSAPQAVSLLLMSIGRKDTPEQAIRDKLLIYQSFIRKIAQLVITRKRSIILKGFFNSNQGYSLWQYHNPFERDDDVNILTDLKEKTLIIRQDHPVEIIYLKDQDMEDNTQISEAQDQNWETSIVQYNQFVRYRFSDNAVVKEFSQARKTGKARKVLKFEEFSFVLSNGTIKQWRIAIPYDLPGLDTLIASVPIAIKAQDMIDDRFSDNAKAGEQKFDGFFT